MILPVNKRKKTNFNFITNKNLLNRIFNINMDYTKVYRKIKILNYLINKKYNKIKTTIVNKQCNIEEKYFNILNNKLKKNKFYHNYKNYNKLYDERNKLFDEQNELFKFYDIKIDKFYNLIINNQNKLNIIYKNIIKKQINLDEIDKYLTLRQTVTNKIYHNNYYKLYDIIYNKYLKMDTILKYINISQDNLDILNINSIDNLYKIIDMYENKINKKCYI